MAFSRRLYSRNAVRKTPLAMPPAGQSLSGELREPSPGQAVLAEIAGPQPDFEGGFQRRPFAVDHRIPGGVAVAALIHRRLAEDAFVAIAETQSGATRRRVQGIAFPFIAA